MKLNNLWSCLWNLDITPLLLGKTVLPEYAVELELLHFFPVLDLSVGQNLNISFSVVAKVSLGSDEVRQVWIVNAALLVLSCCFIRLNNCCVITSLTLDVFPKNSHHLVCVFKFKSNGLTHRQNRPPRETTLITNPRLTNHPLTKHQNSPRPPNLIFNFKQAPRAAWLVATPKVDPAQLAAIRPLETNLPLGIPSLPRRLKRWIQTIWQGRCQNWKSDLTRPKLNLPLTRSTFSFSVKAHTTTATVRVAKCLVFGLLGGELEDVSGLAWGVWVADWVEKQRRKATSGV